MSYALICQLYLNKTEVSKFTLRRANSSLRTSVADSGEYSPLLVGSRARSQGGDRCRPPPAECGHHPTFYGAGRGLVNVTSGPRGDW